MILAIGMAALALVQATAPGPDARSAPLEQVFPFWTDYLALEADERDAFELSYQLTAQPRGDGTPFNFWIEAEDGDYITLDVSAPVTPPGAASFDADHQLYTDAPRGAVRVEMRLTLPGPERTEYTLAELEAALAQAGNAMRRSMGLRSLFMPRLDTIRFAFDGPAPDADFVAPDGEAVPIETVFMSDVLVTPGDRASSEAGRVRFGRAPLYAVLETGR